MWRIIDIGGDNYTLLCNQENFVAVKDGEEKLRVHFSDINSIVVHSYSVVITGVFIQKILEYNIPLIICDRTHNPNGFIISAFKHSEYGNRINLQINASIPLRKKAWQQIIMAKIKNQARVFCKLNRLNEYNILLNYSKEVKSGDSTNREAVASRFYFSNLFEDFKRDSNSSDIINASLNYAYAVLRSNIARAIVGSGLNPALGIFHSHKHNYFCLVDDLIEPLRPFVDFYVKRNLNKIKQFRELNPELKKLLVGVIQENYEYKGEKIDLIYLTQRYVQSYIYYLSKNIKKMDIPEL